MAMLSVAVGMLGRLSCVHPVPVMILSARMVCAWAEEVANCLAIITDGLLPGDFAGS